MEPKSELKKMAEEHVKEFRRTKKQIKNLLLKNLLRTNKKIMKNLDLSNVVLF